MFYSGGVRGGFGSSFGGFGGGGYGSEGGFLPSQPEVSDSTSKYGATRRTTEGLHMYPFTVSLVKKSFQKDPLLTYSDFFGEEVKHVFLVGLVRNLQIDENSEVWTFRLDDGTGSIVVEWCVADCRNFDEHGPSPWAQRRLDQIRDNVYVDLCGAVNMLGKQEPAIRAYNVKRVAVPEEIFAHQIHVSQEIVRRKYPKPDQSACPKAAEEVNTPNRGGLNRSPLSRDSFGISNTRMSGAQQQSDAFGLQDDNEVGNAIVTVLKTGTQFRPQGLTEDDVQLMLMGKGINVDVSKVQQQCRTLLRRSLIYESEPGRWKSTDF